MTDPDTVRECAQRSLKEPTRTQLKVIREELDDKTTVIG
jgi:hypothetical protein